MRTEAETWALERRRVRRKMARARHRSACRSPVVKSLVAGALTGLIIVALAVWELAK